MSKHSQRFAILRREQVVGRKAARRLTLLSVVVLFKIDDRENERTVEKLEEGLEKGVVGKWI